MMGLHVLGGSKDNGLLLLRTLAEYYLIPLITICCDAKEDNENAHPPRSRCWQSLDCVLVHSRNRWDVKVTKTICDTDDETEHRFVLSKMRLQLQPLK
nr:unnamed protein product [Spirometra erinaceieuropaei]